MKLFLFLSFSALMLLESFGNSQETDQQALLQFKSEVSEEKKIVLSSWNNSSPPCKWTGVTCGRKHKRVTGLDLGGFQLRGVISPFIGNLSFLISLNFSDNSFGGTIPQELGNLFRLQYLDMSFNFLGGGIPASLVNCSKLSYLVLFSNHLGQDLPPELGSLSKLDTLVLSRNNLKGKLPVSLGNLTALRGLYFGENKLEGEIPDAIARLTQIEDLVFHMNHFSGVFPPAIYNLSSLTLLNMYVNGFSGSLRPDFGKLLPNLQIFTIGSNFLTGAIPSTLANISNLQLLDMEVNSLTGGVPPSFAKIRYLQTLNLNLNSLGSFSAGDLEFLVALTNCTQLQSLDVSFNRLGGDLPAYIANLSINLNHFEGIIPPTLGKCNYLLRLNIENNKLNGIIPQEIMQISTLVSLKMSNNLLTGTLPEDVGRLGTLGNLSVAHNKLSGKLPETLGKCLAMEKLHLQGNFFDGIIPDIGGLVGIKEVDFSSNNLSGRIPEYLATFSLLEYLNLSFNNFEGNVPTEGKFKNATIFTVSGNKNLCGGVLELRLNPCSTQPPRYSRKKLVIGVSIGISLLLFLFIASVSLCWLKSRKKRDANEETPSTLRVFHEMISYGDLRNATDGFSSSNLIGLGSFGTVFKAFFHAENKFVAVKVLNMQSRGAMRSFMAECESLKDIRHRNLVKLLTACSSIDFQGNEFRALIYEYMPKGSLDMWLHPKEFEEITRPSRTLTLLERLNIAIDVASVLEYLHFSCHEAIAHCDLKPSNETFINQLSSAGVRGSIGYAAPEYAMGGEISVHGDVYSFGILILEMFSGKRPTDEMFGGDLTLRSCIRSALPEQGLDVTDESVLHNSLRIGFPVAACLNQVLEVGLGCSEESPANRLEMSEVVRELISIKERFWCLQKAPSLFPALGFLETTAFILVTAPWRLARMVLFLRDSLRLFPFQVTVCFPTWLNLRVLMSLEALGNSHESDKQTLFKFKSQVSEEKKVLLSSWNNSFPLCEWTGVTCDGKHNRVTGLDLGGFKLGGVISPSIGNLSSLQSLNFTSNSFGGTIPQELGNLFRLQHLFMSYNFLVGGIPTSLFNCSRLLDISLYSNHLGQGLPSELGSLTKLVNLDLGKNNLKGKLPVSLGNLTSLRELSFLENNLEGEIPDVIARLTQMVVFALDTNHFSGVFPPAIYNLSSLQYLSMFGNGFTGNLRPDFGNLLPNIRGLYIGNNSLTGAIPSSLTNISTLQVLGMELNSLTGSIPRSFGKLQALQVLSLNHNSLGNFSAGDLEFLVALTNSTQLQIVDVAFNRLGGDLPASIVNLSMNFNILLLRNNFISGSIPHDIGNLIGLQAFWLSQNLLKGPIPASIGKLSGMVGFGVHTNRMSGEIPYSLGNITRLETLQLFNNNFEGIIPPSLGKCSYLLDLSIENNKFNGIIPTEILQISTLVSVNMSNNLLTGSLPGDVGRLENLGTLSVAHNKLLGKLPETLGKCLSLEELHLQGNSFDGVIPDISGLVGIKKVDFSDNNLSGRIPEYLTKFSLLEYLNLSFNNFEGNVPTEGKFKNATIVSVFGNQNLCGGVLELQLQPCFTQLTRNSRKKLVIGVSVGISLLLLLFMASVSLCWLKIRKKKNINEATPSTLGYFHEMLSYGDIRNATDGFSSSNLIGSGGFGTVFKASLDAENKVVAVKVLNMQRRGAMKSFIAECESLKDIRHRNLVKLLTACSSIDFQRNEFRALIYEYMPNGSLDMWLHPKEMEKISKPSRTLTLLERLNIAIDVASVLEYLHVSCHEAIAHCDLKPSNVLLDDDLTAHVSDFGLARILLKFDQDAFINQLSSAGVRGSIGYAAPEYGMGGEISVHGDAYSFGILMLEMFSGKRPTDGMFGGDFTLRSCIKSALPEKVLDVADELVLHNGLRIGFPVAECLTKVLKVGLGCSEESPANRLGMRNALRVFNRMLFSSSLIALALPPLTQAFITSLGEESVVVQRFSSSLIMTHELPPRTPSLQLEENLHLKGAGIDRLHISKHKEKTDIHLLFSASQSLGEEVTDGGEALIFWSHQLKVFDIDWCKAPETGLLLAPDCVLHLDISPEIAAERYERVDFQRKVTDFCQALGRNNTADPNWLKESYGKRRQGGGAPANGLEKASNTLSGFGQRLTKQKNINPRIINHEIDKQALFKFKSQVSEEKRVLLFSWNNSSPLCRWTGVTCGRKHKRVTGLDLGGFKLGGVISPSIGNLSFLRSLDLNFNSFGGTIPRELGNLFRLQHLNMSFNFLGGGIPAGLFNCSELLVFDLFSNHLGQGLPSELGSLSKLVVLDLGKNNLKGKLPVSLGNLTSLRGLSFAENNLEGEIPDALARLNQMVEFSLAINHFSGVFPPVIYHFSSLQYLNMFGNNFSGNLRPDFGNLLPNLRELHVGSNSLTGTIPSTLSNISTLQYLAMELNSMTGSIPVSFAKLRYLQTLGLNGNSLGCFSAGDIEFLVALTNCTKLQSLDVSFNRLGGDLPASIANLSINLRELFLGINSISGSIPHDIGNLKGLQSFWLPRNLLKGPIPASFGKLPELVELSVYTNRMSGEIPYSLGNITRLEILTLFDNSFEGIIPPSIGRCSYLLRLHIHNNKLNGNIPQEVMQISTLVSINMSNNSLTGSLPEDVGRLGNLVILNVAHNKLSGKLPKTLGKCLSMEKLGLQGNSFEGIIPDINGLVGIKYVDFSSNNLSGRIPEYLANFSYLEYLNLSFNNFEGNVPTEGKFKNATIVSVSGNKNLCGGVLELRLRPCSLQPARSSRKKLVIGVSIGISLLLLLFIASISVCWLKSRKKKNNNEATPSTMGVFHEMISYGDLRNATDGLSSSNLIGSGSFGTVFKAFLPAENKVVAVKVLNMQRRGAMKSFMAECESLKDIRHRNLVKLLTACSSIDFQGNEFRALIYEYMPNGSLDMWLHPTEMEEISRPSRTLTLLERLNIAIDVASVLEYLRLGCHEAIAHCDLKPSNVLLDDDLTAHVSDFGLARILLKFDQETFINQLSSAGVRGSIGYAAPEYAMGGEITVHGDAYSFGILIFEMFSGKRPTDEMFGGDFTLRSSIRSALPEQVLDVADDLILHNGLRIGFPVAECLTKVLEVGLGCSEESPANRLGMSEVVKDLISIKESVHHFGLWITRNLSSETSAKPRGALIVVERLDRSGKSTQCAKLLFFKGSGHQTELWRLINRAGVPFSVRISTRRSRTRGHGVGLSAPASPRQEAKKKNLQEEEEARRRRIPAKENLRKFFEERCRGYATGMEKRRTRSKDDGGLGSIGGERRTTEHRRCLQAANGGGISTEPVKDAVASRHRRLGNQRSERSVHRSRTMPKKMLQSRGRSVGDADDVVEDEILKDKTEELLKDKNDILRKTEEELRTELKKNQKMKEFKPNMNVSLGLRLASSTLSWSLLRRHAKERERGHVLKRLRRGINNVLRQLVPVSCVGRGELLFVNKNVVEVAKMTREEWKKLSDKQKAPYEKGLFFSYLYLHSQLYKSMIVKELRCDIKQVAKKNKETYLEAVDEYKRTKEEETMSQNKEEEELTKLLINKKLSNFLRRRIILLKKKVTKKKKNENVDTNKPKLTKDAKKALTEEHPPTSNSTITPLISVKLKGHKVKASVIICFTSSGRAGKEKQQVPRTSQSSSLRLDHGKQAGVIKLHERQVVCQKVGDACGQES
ncbi:unnamed protein product [Brassica oleracea]